jgi:hypothetical protein
MRCCPTCGTPDNLRPEEDHDTALTPEYLESVGFVRRKVDDMIMEIAEGMISVVSVPALKAWQVDGERLPSHLYPQTRGGLRLLCAILEIALKEPA